MQLLPWPVYLPDILPVENVWDFIDQRIARDHPPTASTGKLWVRIQRI